MLKKCLVNVNIMIYSRLMKKNIKRQNKALEQFQAIKYEIKLLPRYLKRHYAQCYSTP